MHDGNMNNFETGEREPWLPRRDVVEEMCGAPEDGAASGLLGEHGAEAGLVRQTPDHSGEPPA